MEKFLISEVDEHLKIQKMFLFYRAKEEADRINSIFGGEARQIRGNYQCVVTKRGSCCGQPIPRKG